MKLSVKWNLAKFKEKLSKWQQQVDSETTDSLTAYGKEAANAMLRCTPPAHRGTTPARALKALKDRIRADFEGGGDVEYQDSDIIWFHSGGQLRAAFATKGSGRPSPFRLVQGRVSKAALAAMSVGRHHVEFVGSNLAGFMRTHRDQYYMARAGSSYRLKWRGPRHITTRAAVRAEIRRRQRLAGSLMSGWRPFAHKVGVRLPGQAERLAGKGTVATRSDARHKAVMTATNNGNYPGLQAIVDRQIPMIRRKNRAIAKKRARAVAKKLAK